MVGRQRELAEVLELLRTKRVVTLIGAGGCGKTRLALEAGAIVSSSSADSVCLVELAPVAEPSLVPVAVAAAFDVKEDPDRALLDTLLDRLAGFDGLLVLDNCEHLIEASADLVDRLVRRCRRLKVLATSREALRVDGEVAWMVPLLTLPDLNTPLRKLERSEAVQLFVDRASHAWSEFQLTETNATDVGSICRQLDGLPLAIELAASRVAVTDVKSISEQLTDRFRFLKDGLRTAAGRHRTLRAAIDWSDDLLTVEERQTFHRLSVFAGTFDILSAERICGDGGVAGARIAELVENLLGKSLVVRAGAKTGGQRYRLLESIRAYAQEQLLAERSFDRYRRRHAEFFSELAYQRWYSAAAADKFSYLGPNQARWAAQMVIAIDNVREALAWSRAGDREIHLRLATGMGRLCMFHGYGSEGAAWLDGAIRSSHRAAAEQRALAAEAASVLASHRYDHAKAEAYALQRLRLWQRLRNDDQVAAALGTLGYVLVVAGRYKDAAAPIARQLAMARSLRSLPLQESAYWNLGLLEFRLGQLEQAREHLLQSLNIAEGESRDPTLIHSTLGRVLLSMGNLDDARTFINKSVVSRFELSDLSNLALDLDAAAELAVQERALGRAMRIAGAADAIRDQCDRPLGLEAKADRARWTGRAERSLGRLARVAWEEGRQLSAAEAVAYATVGTDAPPPRAIAAGEPFLSGREIQVCELVALGMTNDQIGLRLGLSKRTVDAHLEHIRGKLGVRSRVEIAAWLRERSKDGSSSKTLGQDSSPPAPRSSYD